ncbi:MAG TPA: type II secretion system protein [Tepidisphaeraceae bacterium]
MTSPTSANPLSADRRGFTLIELLTSIGIIAVLAGILLPVISRARVSGQRAALTAELRAISVALEAYKGDFNDYPAAAAGNLPLTGAASQYAFGSVLLARTLVANAPALAAVTPGNTNDDHYEDIYDGHDGPGFRTRPGGSGRVYGPYLPDTFRVINNQLVDRFDNPILYYPARPGPKPQINVASLYINNAAVSLFDYRYGEPKLSRDTFRYLMGDTNYDGRIDGSETAAVTDAPFVLWSAGPDGNGSTSPLIYGIDTAGSADEVARRAKKNDDVTTFR